MRRGSCYWLRRRIFGVYGPGEVLGAGRWRGTPATVWRNVAPTFVYRALKGMPLVLDNGATVLIDRMQDVRSECAYAPPRRRSDRRPRRRWR